MKLSIEMDGVKFESLTADESNITYEEWKETNVYGHRGTPSKTKMTVGDSSVTIDLSKFIQLLHQVQAQVQIGDQEKNQMFSARYHQEERERYPDTHGASQLGAVPSIKRRY